MPLLPYIADICLVPRGGFHVDVIIIRGFAAGISPVAFYMQAALNRVLVLSADLELLKGRNPTCNTQALNKETFMGSHRAF